MLLRGIPGTDIPLSKQHTRRSDFLELWQVLIRAMSSLLVLENFPLLMYILAAKTLILCLAFAGVKIYQSKKIEQKIKKEREAKLKKEAEKKED
ncbi:neuron-specific protein family member 1 [Platysternon megacephalum]|uniref:Neuron-specific protein family member 1 n=1 Tax=Platysternon megacephalum TaxID=55544 RepID=A0A4D9EKQ6_9SAUR|nr:neuron-specific protein family member 1 [Platysternon megacephalum]